MMNLTCNLIIFFHIFIWIDSYFRSSTRIMHKNRVLADIICMIIPNLKVIDLDRAFEYFVLNLFDCDVLAV